MENGAIKNIYLLRHGKVEGKAALNGFSDVLVQTEIQQRICESLIEQNLFLDCVVTSPYRLYADKALCKLSDLNMGYRGILNR